MSRPRKTPALTLCEYDPNDFITAAEATDLFHSITGIKSMQYNLKQGNIRFEWGREDDNRPRTDRYVRTSDNRQVMYRVAAIEREAKVFLSNKIQKAKV